VLTAEEMAQLEEMKLSGGLPPPRPAQPIPEEMTKGWWRISQPEQLQELIDALNPRGIREKELKHALMAHLEHSAEAGISPCHGSLEFTPSEEEEVVLRADSPLPWAESVALRVDMAVLEQVEVMEDKVANASMQVKVRCLPSMED